MLVSILIPCYNEEKNIPFLYNSLIQVIETFKNYDWEFLFINDGSNDNSLAIIKNLSEKDNRVKYIDLSRNFGKEAAMLAGIDFVEGDAVIIMDADLQHPPSLIPEMIKEWENGFDDVYAKRISRGKESNLRKKLSHIFYKTLNNDKGVKLLPNVGDFRLLDRKCIEAVKQIRETERYTKGIFSWIGFKKKELLFHQADRIAGASSMDYSKLMKLAINGYISNTTFPLRLATFIGFLVSLSGFFYMIFILIRTLLYGDEVRGFPTIIIIILFIGGVQLISLGIIGEYIAQITHESKNRPVYFIQEKKL